MTLNDIVHRRRARPEETFRATMPNQSDGWKADLPAGGPTRLPKLRRDFANSGQTNGSTVPPSFYLG